MNVEYGKPFDLTLLCGPQTESGRNLGAEDELVPVLAKALFLLGQTPIRETAFGATNNLARTLESVNDDGSINCWGSLGVAVFRFSGREVARYFARVAGEGIIQEWAEVPADDDLPVLLKDVSHQNKLHDVDAYMTLVYTPDQGEETLGDFASEAAALLRVEKVRAKDLDARLDGFAKGFRTRLERVVERSEERAKPAALAFSDDVRDKVMGILNRAGPRSGSALVGLALAHLSELRDQLEGQRESIMKDVGEKEAIARSAIGALKRAASKSRTGRLAGVRKPLNGYLAAAKEQFSARHGLEVTTIALKALTLAREQLLQLKQVIDDLGDSMRAAAQRCRELKLAFESRPVTPVTEMVDRPIYDDEELKQLYRWACGSDWGALTNEASGAVRQRAGGLSACTGLDGDAIASGFIEACLPVFEVVNGMTADEFVRWRRDELGKSPTVFLRDAAALASPLSRFDRTAMSVDEYDEGSLAILGVTAREESVFAATPLLTLVSTGDRETVSYVALTLGYASKTLWQFQDYAEANKKIKKQGRTAARIYPGFPPPANDRGKPKRRRPGSRKRK